MIGTLPSEVLEDCERLSKVEAIIRVVKIEFSGVSKI